MSLAARARATAGAVAAAWPWGLTPQPWRGAALRQRSRRATASHLATLGDLPTPTLLAVLCEPISENQARLAEPIARELASRRLSAAQLDLAARAAVRAGAVEAAVWVMENATGVWASVDAEAAARIATVIGSPDRAATAGELSAAFPAADATLLASVAAADSAWDAVAEFVLAGGGAPADQRATWALAAARDGNLSAAVTLAEGVRARLRSKDARRQLALAHDHLELLAQGAPEAGEPREPIERRAGAALYVVSQSLPHRSGGYATRTHGIAKALRERGWDERVLTRLGFPYTRWRPDDRRVAAPVDVVDGVEYHRALREGVRSYPDVPLAPYVRDFAEDVEREARRHGAEVIHAASFFQTALGAGIAAKRLGLPFVYELRGLEDIYRTSRDPRFAATEEYRFERSMELAVCAMADRVLCITRALRGELIADGVPAEKISVLGNGVEAADFAPATPDLELKAALGLEGKTVLGYAGSTVDYEGLELLIDALEELADPSVALVVVGDGAHYSAVVDRANASAVRDSIVFVGRVPYAEVPRYLSFFDVLPFPRLPLPVTEMVSPMKPFEAMAMGKAVVVSDVAALAEIVEDGVTGLTFRKGDSSDLARALRALVKDPALRDRLGAAARTDILATATWQHRVEAADAAYRELGASPASS
jgi:glycosyltransferase involved in cell wall biosynthesis